MKTGLVAMVVWVGLLGAACGEAATATPVPSPTATVAPTSTIQATPVALSPRAQVASATPTLVSGASSTATLPPPPEGATATPAPTATVAATTTPGTPVSPPAEPTPTRPPPPTPVPSPTPEPTPNPTAAPTHAPARLPGTHDVEITGGFAFSPNDVTVRVGDTVVWTVTGIGHTTTSGTPTEPSGTWDSGFLRVGESFSQTLTAPGELLYFCNIHKSMRGKVTVTE